MWSLRSACDPVPAIDTAWCGNVASVHGSPIVTTTDGRANPLVFALGAQGDSRLYAFRGDTGELLVSPPDRVPGTKDFETLIAADGRLYVTRRREGLRLCVLGRGEPQRAGRAFASPLVLCDKSG